MIRLEFISHTFVKFSRNKEVIAHIVMQKRSMHFVEFLTRIDIL